MTGLLAILLIAAFVALASAVSALVVAAMGGFCGTRPVEIILGAGPRLCAVHVGTTIVSVRLFPFGSAVRFADADTATSDHAPIAALPWFARALVGLSGPLAVVLIGSALAPETASTSLLAIFQALPRLFTDATGVVQQIDQWARTVDGGVRLAAGVFLTMGAVSLLPIPHFSGGRLLLDLLEAMGVPEKLTDALLKVSIFAYFVAVALLTITLVRHGVRLYGG